MVYPAHLTITNQVDSLQRERTSPDILSWLSYRWCSNDP